MIQQVFGVAAAGGPFLVTFTLPEELRRVARSNQKTVYNILFRASSEALQKLVWDERFVCGRVGMVHTWTRALIYHPHAHYITSGARFGRLPHGSPMVSMLLDFT